MSIINRISRASLRSKIVSNNLDILNNLDRKFWFRPNEKLAEQLCEQLSCQVYDHHDRLKIFLNDQLRIQIRNPVIEQVREKLNG